jgi:hypothetical protein
MSSYNFKNFFSEKTIHNNECASNAHFLIKKSELKKSQLEFVNAFPMDEKLINSMSETLKNESRKDIITEFIPERITKDIDYNILIMRTDSGNIAIQEGYYNFLQSLKCRVCIINESSSGILAIYNKNIEFVGILLPLRLNHINISNSQDYNEYLEQLEVEKEAKEQSKQNSKKCLYISNNKAIVRNKELICVSELVNDEIYKNLYIEKNISDSKDAEVYLDLGIVCLYVKTIQKNRIIKDTEYWLKNITKYTLEMILEEIRNQRTNNQFVNIADIKLIELSGASEQEVQELIEYRQNWYNKKVQEEQERRLKQEQEDREYIKNKNKIVEEAVLKAEQAIINKQEVKNQDITIYKSKYDNNTLSLILHMMKLNNIKVPLKTQGWINQALANISYNQEWKDYSYNYYKSSANSKVFTKYLNQLIKAIQNKYISSVTV